MLKHQLIHPKISEVLARAGHHSVILIADGNYPLLTRSYEGAHQVYLNLAPGKVTVTDVLEVLMESIPVEAAHVMGPDDGSEPDIYPDFRRLLGPELPLQRMGRFG